MIFYSGFSLRNDALYFEELFDASTYNVAGFSYGAIKAYKYAREQVACGNRVDRLQLFSPAFFQNRSKGFKKLQLNAYRKDERAYLEQFVASCFFPHAKREVLHKSTSADELEELLEYIWDVNTLKKLQRKGVIIEVYLGSSDAIIDPTAAKEFFVECSSVTLIQGANHFLQII